MGAIADASPSTSAVRSRDCVSASDGMTPLRRKRSCGHGIGPHGFREDRREGRNLAVPFDQGRLWPKPTNGMRVQVPDRFGDAVRMRVDENLGPRFGLIVL